MFDDAAERTAVLGLIRGCEDAWNRGDAAGYAAPFTDDASFVAWNGLHGYGREAIEDAHRRLFDGPMAGSRLRLLDRDTESPRPESPRPESLRFVRPDIAIMVTAGVVTRAGEGDSGHDSVQTFVLTKNADRWQVAAFHNTRRQADS